MRLLAHALLIALAVLPASLRAADGADSATVTERNLLASERFWPYHVGLTKPFQALRPGTTGVLIRVETSSVARIDFGRDGLFEVPVAATDLVDRANRVRRGELTKKAPNFVLALGPRLVDTSSEPALQYSFERAGEQRSFLAVFADPGAKGFADLAKALAPLTQRDGLLTILLPQGEHPDPEVYGKLRTLEWNVPFVYSHLTGPYTRSLLPAGAARPALMLQTPEGRVLFQSEWKAGVAAELNAALDAALGSSS